MESGRLVATVCAGYCAFFKPGKDEALACKGFLVLQELSRAEKGLPGFPEKRELRGETREHLFHLLCPHCPFSSEGCDFAAWNRGEMPDADREGVTPCGGFLFLANCIDQGTIDIQALNGVI
jgi:hypothetical protein